jgi:cytochrome b
MGGAHQGKVYVWDPMVRIIHWSLVVAFTVAFLTEDDALNSHVWAGYAVGILVIGRVFWGFVGPRHARFSDFVYRPGVAVRYVSDLLRFRSQRFLGHSPGGGTMVVLLLALLAATVLTGLVVYGGDQQAGPLAGIVSRSTGERLEKVHEVLANITVGFVFLHVAAVAFASFAHKENLVRSMLTGFKKE